MNKTITQAISKLSVAALFAAGSLSANAFEIEKDGWTFAVHGVISTNYVYTGCDSTSAATVDAAFLCSDNGVQSRDISGIQSGYVPTNFTFTVSTHKAGYDLAVNVVHDQGLDENQSFNGSDSSNDDGFRTWMTVGNADMGSVLFGRDYGIFANDITYADMSVYGVGGPFSSATPANATLAASGTGYIFVDRFTQVTWTLPTIENLTAQIGAFQPFDLFGGTDTGSSRPGFHGRLRYDFDGGFISTSGLTQDVQTVAGADYTATAWDVTGQYALGPVTLTGSYHMADGVGHTGLFIDAVDAANQAKETDGYLVQAMYQATEATRFGVNYGVTNVDDNAADVATSMDEKNKITAGVYHNLATGIILSAEFSKLEAKNKAGGEIENDVFNVGAIFFF